VIVAEVDPHDEPALRRWYAALAAGATAGRSAPLVESWPAISSSLQRPGPSRRRIPVAARRGEEVLGAMLVELPLTEDLTTAAVEVDVPPGHRRQGVGRALWEWATAFLAGQGRSVVQGEVHVPAGQTTSSWPGALFAEALGARTENVEDHLVLGLPARPEPVPPAAGYRLVSWLGRCPDEFVDAYAAMWSAMSADVPTGGLEREAACWDAARIRATEERLAVDYQTLVTLALAPDGEPAGYTLIYADRTDSANALQDDTFVRGGHRGHGLGLRLKLANLQQVDAGRRRLHTWTADDNVAMQRVNARFGFQLVERTHEYQWRRGGG
jgi:GNAT superfamily N-acetyltransferase